MFFTSKESRKGNGELSITSIEENINYIFKELNYTADLKTREIKLHKRSGKFVFLETMTDSEQIEKNLLIPLLDARKTHRLVDVLTKVNFNKTMKLEDAINALLSGNCVVFLEAENGIYYFEASQENSRSPEEPENERVVRGSHQGFVESLDVNLNLIRTRIKNRHLMIKNYQLGTDTNTEVVIMYLDDIANSEIVKEVEDRIQSISLNMIFSPGFIEECIEDSPFSPFPQNLYTERPDRLEAHLIEGRVAIMSEGSTDAIILPVPFFSFFHTPDDYNNRFTIGSVFRLLRLFSFWGSLTLPAIYIAVIGFHFEVIPYEVITLVKSSIETVPFPPLLEALVMAITIELIREAGIRLPSPIGETIGIVGGLIIGESVVNAGLVSNVMVIVIAVTAIMSFTITTYEMGNTARILSLPIMFAAAMFGFAGIVVALMFIIIHMCKLESYGTPYLSPLAPLNMEGLKDAFIRLPVWLIDKRPKYLHTKKVINQSESREWMEDDTK